MSVIKKLHKNSLLNPTHDFCLETHYEVMMGSIAYNVAQDTSDMDVHAICIPPLEMIFPHLNGHIRGFGDAPENFETFQQHHIDFGTKNYDIAIYSIVKVFDLAAQNNPNVLDMLWVPEKLHLAHRQHRDLHTPEQKALFEQEKLSQVQRVCICSVQEVGEHSPKGFGREVWF